MERLLSLPRIARLLDLSVAAVQRMFDSGTLPAPVRLPGGELRWRAGDVDAWMCELPSVAVENNFETVVPSVGPTLAPPVAPPGPTWGQGSGPTLAPLSENETDDVAEEEADTKVKAISRAIMALLRSTDAWISGAEIAEMIGEDIDHRSGTFKRAMALLRDAGLVQPDNKRGYRAVQIDSS